MVNGVGLGFNYNQRIAVMKQNLHYSVWSTAVSEDIEFVAQGNNNVQNYSKEIMFLTSQLSMHHEGQMLELINETGEQFILQIHDNIKAIIQININHERELIDGHDFTKLSVYISTVPAN